MVNRGEEEVWVQMNVVPRSTGNTNSGTRELTTRGKVRFPPRSKDFFFASCGSLFPFTRANAQWVIHGFKVALYFTLQSEFSGSTICVPSATRHNIHSKRYAVTKHSLH